MAKSLRSKRRRKMRAVKRVRYGEKELERLKKTLGNDEVKKELDVVMAEVSDIVTITTKKSIKEKAKKQTTTETTENMDDDTVKHIYNPRSMKDQFGTYPTWMNQRRVSKRKKSGRGGPKRK